MQHNKTLLLALGLVLSTPLLAKKKETQKEIESGQAYLARDDYENALKHYERAVRVARDPFEKMQARLAVAHLGLEIVRDDAIDNGDENTVMQVSTVEQLLFTAQTQLSHPAKRYQALQNGEEIMQCISVTLDPNTSEIAVGFITDLDAAGSDIGSFNFGENFMVPVDMSLIPYEENLDDLTDTARFRTLISKLNLPDEASTEAKRQLKRLEAVPPESPEKHVITQYLDTFLALPWGKFTEDNLDLAAAKETLDSDHYGLHEIKERILDFLAVRTHCKNPHATIICFVGPPGVGKTSLGKSIAKALDRNFERIAVGGVHDESEIRGHRSTYVGAMPGKIIKAMKKAGSMNPVLLIDEIDKVGKSNHRGDPSSALLEVLDPEQNDSFVDHYLDVPFDLSKVLFITTTNDLSTMPDPLKDRMEIIELTGYTLDEKMEIAKQHLLPQARESCGLMQSEVELSDAVLQEVIVNHTREAGVRELRRVLNKLCAKYTRALVDRVPLPAFAKDNLTQYIGPVHTNSGLNFHRNRVGMTNGLAWTSVGGVMIQIEAVLAPGRGKLHHTGKQGTMSLEAAKTALTWVKTHAKEFDIAPEKFTESDLHIHNPAGWNSDGPSAGVTTVCTILSAFTDRPIDASYAMTGEVSLHGDVLAIGGLKEKLLAAKHEGVLNVFIPKSNVVDLEKIETITEGMNIMPVENVSEIIKKVLLPKPKNSFF